MGLQQDDEKEKVNAKKWDLSYVKLKQNVFAFVEAALNTMTLPQDGVGVHPT